jgi:peptide/nickel transport system permease protein
MSAPLRIVFRRVIQAMLAALVVGTLCFFMVRALPGDLAFRVAAGRYGSDGVTIAASEAVRAELGLDKPALQALMSWWGQLLQFDLGRSFINGKPVWGQLLYQLGYTVELALAAIVLGILFGLPLGVAASFKPGGWIDRAGLALSVALRSLPPFLTGILLIILFSLQLRLLPAAGFAEPANIVLPALTLALGLAAPLSRVTRDALASVRATPFYAYGRAKGLGEPEVLLRHGLRNAAGPVVAYIGVQLVFLIEGVVVIEMLFSWPGIGHALVHAIFGRDVPVIQGVALMMSLGFVLLNTAVDLAGLLIDPRTRSQ